MQRLARCVPSMFQKDMTRGEVLRYALAYALWRSRNIVRG